MAAGTPVIAIDTNLLVYAHRSAAPLHMPARRAIEAAARDPRGWGIALPGLAEFWSVVTHPAAPGRPSSGPTAAAFIESLVRDGGAAIWVAGARFWERLARAAVDLRVRGARIFDLQIALTALDNGAREIWTHDTAFVAPAGLKVIDPLA